MDMITSKDVRDFLKVVKENPFSFLNLPKTGKTVGQSMGKSIIKKIRRR